MYKILLENWRLLLILVLTAGGLLIPFLLSSYVSATTSQNRFTDISQIPSQKVAIVFGAGVYPDGRPSPMLADRIETAIALYQKGQVQKLLMTGDNSRDDYDEVGVMQQYAVEKGVPIEDITLDHAGFSTYESCYRAKEIFGVEKAVLVTQNFHLPRAVYTCERLGVESVGLGTPDWDKYSNETIRKYTLREKLSILKAIWEVHITRPKPTFLGEFEGID